MDRRQAGRQALASDHCAAQPETKAGARDDAWRIPVELLVSALHGGCPVRVLPFLLYR